MIQKLSRTRHNKMKVPETRDSTRGSEAAWTNEIKKITIFSTSARLYS